MTSWIWHNISLELPDDWEMLQFANNPERGRIAFADRYDFRMELSWRKTNARPDLDGMVKDYHSHLLHELEHEDVDTLKNTSWTGLQSSRDGKVATRFMQHFDDAGFLVEIVFRWADQRDERLEDDVLNSLYVENSAVSKKRNWKCFGLDMELQSEFELSEINALPASVVMDFGVGKKDKATVRAERRGLTDFWLKCSISDWLIQQLPSPPKKIETSRVNRWGHEIIRIKGFMPFGSGWGKIFRRQEFESIGWICPHDRRFYSLRRLNRPSKASYFGSEGFKLSCCPNCSATL